MSIRKLKEVYALTHPAARLDRAAANVELNDEKQAEPAVGNEDEATKEAAIEELFSHLAAEDDEDSVNGEAESLDVSKVDGDAVSLEARDVDSSSKDRS